MQVAGYMFGIIGNTLSSGRQDLIVAIGICKPTNSGSSTAAACTICWRNIPIYTRITWPRPEPNRRKTLEDYFIKYLEREKPELLKSVSLEGAPVAEDTTGQTL